MRALASAAALVAAVFVAACAGGARPGAGPAPAAPAAPVAGPACAAPLAREVAAARAHGLDVAVSARPEAVAALAAIVNALPPPSRVPADAVAVFTLPGRAEALVALVRAGCIAATAVLPRDLVAALLAGQGAEA